MKIKGKSYKPIGNGLGYCVSGSLFKKKVFYFKGYPQNPYEDCEIIELKHADPKSFISDTVMGEGRDKNNNYYQGKIVKKGKGIKLNQDWEFVPNKGIKCQSVALFFKSKRSEICSLMGNEQEFNFALLENEDSYKEFQNSDTWIKLFYDKSDELKEIEFLQGKLRIKDISMIGEGKNVFQLMRELEGLGFNLIRKENNYWLDAKNKFTISSSEDMGGDSTECVYLYNAYDINHLIDE